MKKLTAAFLPVLLCLPLHAQVPSVNWALTDAIGRRAPQYGEVSAPRQGKQVAMFYWTWHTDGQIVGDRVGNITEILRDNPDALLDSNHPAWDTGGHAYFWDEPLLGYYRTTDPWVLRKHAEMLADAGVDVVFFDCTNGNLVWKSSYDVLLETWSGALKDGVNVPKIAFMLPFGPIPPAYESLRFLYEDIYSAGRYPELWFMWEGKPLIMAYDSVIPNDGDPLNDTLREYFTYRPGQPDYVDGPADNRQWGWAEVFPQHRYGVREDGTCEQVVVGVAQNANAEHGGHCYAFNAPGAFSRSYTHALGHVQVPDSYLYGFNFLEQWNEALRIDPDLVFVTGWNEFIAGKHDAWPPHDPYLPYAFPDQYDWDCSRDIEPVKAWGQYADNYYCQLVDMVRRFKGVAEPEPASAPVTIDPADFTAWNDVSPYYKHYAGNTFHRDHPGHADTCYTNSTGRNDITGAKVARDKEYVYFYAETAGILTDPAASPNWMLLFIDTDRDKSTGWEGYDFVVNRNIGSDGKTVVEKSSHGWNWEKAGEADLCYEGGRLCVRIPRRVLGLEGQKLNIEFKWNDNLQEEGNIIDFYVNGDTAPGGRFNFIYSE